MIISRTPFRISFVGGGTDLRDYYRHGYGAVVSTAIQKYVYVSVNKKFDDKIRVSYSQTEIVDDVDDLRHELVREALKLAGIKNGIEVVTIADIPGRGTGLGSSSSLTVGLLNALHTYLGQKDLPETLARQACKIEIELLGQPIGKQDQYIAAYGGLNYIRFNADETILVEPVNLSKKKKREFEENLMCFYTGITRKSSAILNVQKKNVTNKLEVLDKMRDQADEVWKCLAKNDLTKFGEILHEAWLLKKQLASGITNPLIDSYYSKARRVGAFGGKISGAGGGGFLTLYCEKEKQPAVRKVLQDLKEMKIRFEPQGSKTIYSGEIGDE